MRWIPGARQRDARGQFLLLAVVALAVVALAVAPVLADHKEVSLTGSDFEIDTNANLVLDDSSGLDWATVTEERRGDLPSGSGDDSFGQGSKEDTAVPAVVSGSIPPNKSDLKTFGVYQEENASGKFLHLYWTRVQDPSGTTNMDFEFNQSTVLSSNGVTPVRTAGDLLITYDLSKGGTVPILSLREWTGTAWGPPENLSGSGNATGSINTTAIAAGNSDGLGSLSARTFGEASINLDVIFDEGQCDSFGSAYLKSRSSDSFTAALKDFIAPIPVNISNCGSVQIEKVDDLGDPLAEATFVLYIDNGDAVFDAGDVVATDPDGATLTCTTDATGFCSIANVLFGDYWVDETVVPANHDKPTGLPAQFAVAGTTLVELGPYTNDRQRGSILVEKVVAATTTRLDGASFALDADGNPDTTGDQTAIPAVSGETGVFCIDGLLYGDYTVVETQAPSGYLADTETQAFTVDSKSDCSNRSTTPDLTFENTAQPQIVTSAQTPVTVGADIWDTATLSGGFNPTGTITFTLYENDQCSGTAVFSDTVTVDAGNSAYDSGKYTTNAAGTYYWIAAYSGDASNAAVSGSCKDAGETSVVDKEDPTIVTVAVTPVTVGADIWDTATLSGGFAPTGTITFTLYSDSDCTTAVAGYSSSVPVNGNGDYDSAKYTTAAAGSYYWIASYSGDTNNDPVSGSCGDAGETSVVNPAVPSLDTTPKLLPNDDATLSGLFGTPSGTITFELHATADCSGEFIYSETQNVNGNGTYSTTNTTVFITEDGTYSWLVTYSGDANNTSALSACDAEQQVIDFTPLFEIN